MPTAQCKFCKKNFHVSPWRIKSGWGIYCSLECKYLGSAFQKKFSCFTCGQDVFKTPSKIRNSKSGKFFCSKSCQTKWRNVVFSGEKHSGYKDGKHTYRRLLKKADRAPECEMCGTRDRRVLAAHHIDENRAHNGVKNLSWLCHNCHKLVHYDNVEKQRFLKEHKKKFS